MWFKTCLLITFLLLAAQSKFPDSSYSQYSWKEFYKLSDANQPLDFKNPDMGLLDACVFYATNEQREGKGCSQFSFSPNLHSAADFHTNEMITKNFFNHINPSNRAYRTPDQRVKAFDGRYNMYGENIAYFTSANTTYLDLGKKLVDQWMHSPEHRANLLNKQFTFLGCGVGIKVWKSQGGVPYYYIYGTQDFGGRPY